MLWTIFVILLVMWALGLATGATLNGFIHILLVIAIVVAEAQRGEGYIKEAYESAIHTVSEPRLTELLTQQYESVKESYSWLSGLREEGKRQNSDAT
jgi:hypothetical protein